MKPPLKNKISSNQIFNYLFGLPSKTYDYYQQPYFSLDNKMNIRLEDDSKPFVWNLKQLKKDLKNGVWHLEYYDNLKWKIYQNIITGMEVLHCGITFHTDRVVTSNQHNECFKEWKLQPMEETAAKKD